MEFTLLWAVLTAFGAAWVGTRVWDENLPERPMDRLLGAAVIGLFAGRVTAMIGQGINPITNPLDMILVRGGVSTAAASGAGIASLAWSTRKDPSSMDALAPAVLAGLSGWHAGCLWREACLGAASELPWAWSSPTSDVTRHPVELYAALLLIAAGLIVSRLGWRPYLRSGSALALAGAARLLTEPLRPSLSGGPVGWYTAAIALGLGVILLGPSIHGRLHATST